jgi:disulfide bond formation protein DsbB
MLKNFLGSRAAYFAGFAVSFGLVGLALFLQVQYNLDPCPLCISQRIAFMVLGVLFLIAGLHNPAGLWRKIHGVLQLAAAATGAGIALRHMWIQAHPEEVMAECGAGFDYIIESFPLQRALELIFKGTGECSAIDWTLLGLTIPQQSLIAFVGLALYALVLMFARKR